MPGWAGKLAERIREQERKRQEEQQHQEQRRAAFRENAPRCWAQFVDVVQRDVNEFNEVFADVPSAKVQLRRFPESLRMPPEKVRVSRSGYVVAHAEVFLDMDVETVEVRLSRKTAHEGFAQEKALKFKLVMDGAGVVHLMHGEKPISLEQASEIALFPVLSP
jgi:hypothetical protein